MLLFLGWKGLGISCATTFVTSLDCLLMLCGYCYFPIEGVVSFAMHKPIDTLFSCSSLVEIWQIFNPLQVFICLSHFWEFFGLH